MVLVIILIVPYGLLIVETGMNLNWAVMALQVITSPFLIPIFMTITWSKATTPGVVSGICVLIIFIVTSIMIKLFLNIYLKQCYLCKCAHNLKLLLFIKCLVLI